MKKSIKMNHAMLNVLEKNKIKTDFIWMILLIKIDFPTRPEVPHPALQRNGIAL